jgi:translation initiation factor IF-3
LRIFHKRKFTPRKFYFINFRIEAPELRVLDEKGEQIAVMNRQEALNKAQELGADLVLIAPKAVPPVAKIIDFKKFLYQEEKKEKEAKKGIKKGVVKDINLGLFIGQADMDRMMRRSLEFLADGHQVRINLLLKGRENAKKDMAFALVKKFIASLGEVNISKEPKLEGKIVRAVVAKKK